jgi:hypothetical protein
MRRTDLGIASMISRCTTHTMIESDVLFVTVYEVRTSRVPRVLS